MWLIVQVHHKWQSDLHQVRSVLVYERTKSQSAPEWSRHVGDGHIFVSLTVHPAPLLQSLDGSHVPLSYRHCAQSVRTLRRRRPGGRWDGNKVSAQGLTVNCGAAAASCFLVLPHWPLSSLRDEPVERFSAHYSNWHRHVLIHRG